MGRRQWWRMGARYWRVSGSFLATGANIPSVCGCVRRQLEEKVKKHTCIYRRVKMKSKGKCCFLQHVGVFWLGVGDREHLLSLSHVLQGRTLASGQASGFKASLHVAGHQIGLRHSQLWPRGPHSSQRITLKLPRALFKCNSEWLYVCVSTRSVSVCVTLSTQPAGIQGPFQIRNRKCRSVQPTPVGFRARTLDVGTQLNITAVVINQVAWPAHHPAAIQQPQVTIHREFYCRSGEEDGKRGSLREN